jgi:hypothetical protein
MDDLREVSIFLREHYGDSDWYLDESFLWLHTYLDDPHVCALGLFSCANKLIATIFSTPLTSTETYIDGKPLKNIQVIDGLCVHKSFRNIGIAGYMITAIDHELTKGSCKAVVFLYSRELPYIPPASTHLNVKKYAYIECYKALCKTTLQTMHKNTFTSLWKGMTVPANSGLVARKPMFRRNGIDIWVSNNSVVVVCDTKRRTRNEHLKIWENIWCGNIRDNSLVPGAVDMAVIESVAAKYSGVFFTMAEYFTRVDHAGSWQIGKSGYQAWYIYNYITPKFGSYEIHAIREDI